MVKITLHSNADKEVKKAVACSIRGFKTSGMVFGFLVQSAVLKGGFIATVAS